VVADWLERAWGELHEPGRGGECGPEIAALGLDRGEPLDRITALRIEVERLRERSPGRIERILAPEVVRHLAERLRAVFRG